MSGKTVLPGADPDHHITGASILPEGIGDRRKGYGFGHGGVVCVKSGVILEKFADRAACDGEGTFGQTFGSGHEAESGIEIQDHLPDRHRLVNLFQSVNLEEVQHNIKKIWKRKKKNLIENWKV